MIKRTLVASAALVATVSGALPATTLAGNPVFVADINVESFELHTRVAIMEEPDKYSEGRADFDISVTVKNPKSGFTAKESCKGEGYHFKDGALYFNPYPEETPDFGACTRLFLKQMVDGLGASFTLRILTLVLTDQGRKLIFDLNGIKVELERE
jgi:hypothetical protein